MNKILFKLQYIYIIKIKSKNIYNKIVTFYNKQIFKQMCYLHLIPNTYLFLLLLFYYLIHIFTKKRCICYIS